MNSLLSTRCRRYTCPHCQVVRLILLHQEAGECPKCGEYLEDDLPWMLDDINVCIRNQRDEWPTPPEDPIKQASWAWLYVPAIIVLHALIWSLH